MTDILKVRFEVIINIRFIIFLDFFIALEGDIIYSGSYTSCHHNKKKLRYFVEEMLSECTNFIPTFLYVLSYHHYRFV